MRRLFRLMASVLIVLALAAPVLANDASNSFSAVGNGTQVLAQPTDAVTYSVSGTFSGTVVLEQFMGTYPNGSWTTLVTVTSPTSGSLTVEVPSGQNQARYRWRCSARASGTIVTAISTSGSASGGVSSASVFGDASTARDPFTDLPWDFATQPYGLGVVKAYDNSAATQTYATLNILNLTATSDGNEPSHHTFETVLSVETSSTGGYGFLYANEAIATHLGSGTVGALYGYYSDVENDGTGAVTAMYAYNADLLSAGTGTTVGAAYGYSVNDQTQWGSSGITTMTAFYAGALGGAATNAYSFWSDEAGVFRIRSDNTFNSLYQAIPALYNPQVTKYTPGASNYERCIPGCQWESNVATITTEKGGSGTLRALNIGDANVQVEVNGKNLTLAGALTTSGAFALTLTQTGTTTVTLPTSGTLFSTATAFLQPATGYKSVDGTTGATVTTCSGFKNGLCISGT